MHAQLPAGVQRRRAGPAKTTSYMVSQQPDGEQYCSALRCSTPAAGAVNAQQSPDNQPPPGAMSALLMRIRGDTLNGELCESLTSTVQCWGLEYTREQAAWAGSRPLGWIRMLQLHANRAAADMRHAMNITHTNTHWGRGVAPALTTCNRSGEHQAPAYTGSALSPASA
jgi:hypothetical protein